MTWSVSRLEDGRQLHLHVAGDLFPPGSSFAWEDTFCSRMAAGADHVVADTLADPAYADLPQSAHVRGYVGTPILGPEREVFGVLCGFRAQPLPAGLDIDENLLDLLASNLTGLLCASRLADDAASAERQARQEAVTDPLTLLPNRRRWDAALRAARSRLEAYGDPVSLVILDIDDLKRVNDTRGHQAGDAVIGQVARLLRGQSRQDDVVARIGGDEFGLLVVGDAARALAKRLESLRRELADAGVSVSTGVGLATRPEEFDELFRRADDAMYVQKAGRRAKETAQRVQSKPTGPWTA